MLSAEKINEKTFRCKRILRYILNDITEMADEVESVINDGAFTVPEVLAEVIYVLKSVYKMEKANACQCLIDFLAEIDIEQKNAIIAALDLHSKRALDFVDCILISYNNLLGIEIFSFDEKLNKLLNKK